MNQLSESVNHTIHRLPTALPVVVIEAIPSDLSLISTNIHENGWAILVYGRKLFAWNYTQSSTFSRTCYELILPPSDLSYKADLVCLLFPNEKNCTNVVPAILAVSPEGTIRFWPKIANSSNNFETVAHELQGQECNSLVNLKPFGCILSTTTNSLMQVNINYGGTSLNDSNMITCRLLKMPQGVFAGFKKLSSFIFGAVPISQYFDNKNIIKVLKGKQSTNCAEVLVFTGNLMQILEISHNSDKLVGEIDLDRLLKEGILRSVLIGGATNVDQLNLWIIDAKYKNNEDIVVIFACILKESTNCMYYVVATLSPEVNKNSTNTKNASNFCNLKYTAKHMILLRNYTTTLDQSNEQAFLNLRLVKETAYQQLHYVYDRQKITCIQENHDVVDSIFIGNEENQILGIGVWENQPLVFTSKDSLLKLNPSEELVSFNTSSNLRISEDDLNESDKYYWLKKSFNIYKKKDFQLSQQLIKENFLGDLTLDSELDKNVVLMCSELADSVPNSDPRWAESSHNINYNIVSVLLTNQLEEKFKNFLELIGFLKNSGIWEKLSVYNSDSISMPTKMLLCEHGEKIVAASALKKLEEEFNVHIETVIRNLIEKKNTYQNSNLTIHDLFYRQVTEIHHFIPALYEYEEDCLNNSNLNSKEMLEFIVSCSIIIIIIFQEVSRFRKNQDFFEEALNELKECENFSEYNIWSNNAFNISSKGISSMGIRATLLKQIELLISYGIESKFKPGVFSVDEDLRIRTILYQKLIDITDIVLEGYLYQLSCLQSESERYKVLKKEFENDRAKCIRPLIKVKQFERALCLAEKYEDFDTLITVCEILNNNDRLNRYRIEFEEKGFSEYLFKWYMKEGKQSKMLITSSPFLGKFLENHESLYWLYSIQNNQFDRAGECLLSLAENEDKILEKKKTLYSLSKLSYLANGYSDNNELIENINQKQEIIGFQEILPLNILPKDKKPLNPYEMIKILISPLNETTTEIDFKHALDLTTYIKDDIHKFEEIRKEIIVSAILKDKWESYNQEDPLEYITETFVYKFIKHLFISGDEILFIFPPCEELLLWSEFDNLKNKRNFIYLIKILYENYIQKFITIVN